MITIEQVKLATNTNELNSMVEQAAEERGCELNSSSSYADSADWFAKEAKNAGNGEDDMLELVKIFNAAESRWFELEA
jgi:hypothetical protein